MTAPRRRTDPRGHYQCPGRVSGISPDAKGDYAEERRMTLQVGCSVSVTTDTDIVAVGIAGRRGPHSSDDTLYNIVLQAKEDGTRGTISFHTHINEVT